jgi:hypothetical protein
MVVVNGAAEGDGLRLVEDRAATRACSCLSLDD